MSKFFKFNIALFSICFLTMASMHNIAHAQYKGSYSKKEGKYIDRAARPVPRIFSSQVTSEKEAYKLDELYNELYVSLWNYAVTDFSYQKKLYNLIKAERFQITRYSKEFSGDVKDGMENLIQNHKNMLADIDNANKRYEEIKEGIREVDYETLDKIWPEKIEYFRTYANEYFKMQHAYLKTYRSLVGFIIKQGGSYYFDKTEQRVKFYKFGGYQFFGKSIDKLHKITFEQKKFLKERAPARVDVSSLK